MSLLQYFVHDSEDSHSKSNAYLCAVLSYYSYEPWRTSVISEAISGRVSSFYQALSNDVTTKVKRISGNNGYFDVEGVIITRPEVMFIVFRGTEGLPIPIYNPDLWSSVQDWLLNALKQQVYGIHNGFRLGVNAVYNDIRDYLLEQTLEYPDLRVYLTGHSQGGALAAVCAARLGEDDIQVSGVYNFGTPRIGDRSFRSAYESMPTQFPGVPLGHRTWRWVLNRDPGPRYPRKLETKGVLPGIFERWEYYHVGKLNYINDDGEVFMNKSSPNNDHGHPIFDPGDHDMALMCRHMYRRLSSNERTSVNNPRYLTKNDVIKSKGLW